MNIIPSKPKLGLLGDGRQHFTVLAEETYTSVTFCVVPVNRVSFSMYQIGAKC